MAISLRTNIAVNRLLVSNKQSSDALGQATERLSSGSIVNKTGDDVGAVIKSASVQHSQSVQAKNAENGARGASLVDRASEATAALLDVTSRMYELADTASSYLVGQTQRVGLNSEIQNLRAEFDRITQSATFNQYKILSGGYQSVNVQLGENGVEGGFLVELTKYSPAYLSDVSLNTAPSAHLAKSVSYIAYSAVAIHGSGLSGQGGRLETAIHNLAAQRNNLNVAEGRILDINRAEEEANKLKYKILVERGNAMAAQAENLVASTVFGLLK